MTTKDAIVVAFVDTQLDKRQYKSFYQTAFKWLERDPYQEVGFAVVTGETAASFGVDLVPSIRMYLWNETLVTLQNLIKHKKPLHCLFLGILRQFVVDFNFTLQVD